MQMQMQLLSSEQRFRQAWGEWGVEIANALPTFSIDVVGLVARYLLGELLSVARFQSLRSFSVKVDERNVSSVFLTVDARNYIWMLRPYLSHIPMYTLDGRELTQLAYEEPMALASSLDHVYVLSREGHTQARIAAWDSTGDIQ